MAYACRHGIAGLCGHCRATSLGAAPAAVDWPKEIASAKRVIDAALEAAIDQVNAKSASMRLLNITGTGPKQWADNIRSTTHASLDRVPGIAAKNPKQAQSILLDMQKFVQSEAQEMAAAVGEPPTLLELAAKALGSLAKKTVAAGVEGVTGRKPSEGETNVLFVLGGLLVASVAVAYVFRGSPFADIARYLNKTKEKVVRHFDAINKGEGV